MVSGTVLVTGFGPFPGMPFNPSGEVVRRMAASPLLRRRFGPDLRAIVLRTAYDTIPDILDPELADGPRAVLMVGVAGRATRIRVETRARNRASRLMPDTGGSPARRLTLDPDGPSQRRCGSLGAKAAASLRRAGLPVRLSNDAGRYLCNASYYRALATPCPVLFLHIPRRPNARARRKPGPMPRRDWTRRLADAFADVAVMMAGAGTARPASAGRPHRSGPSPA